MSKILNDVEHCSDALPTRDVIEADHDRVVVRVCAGEEHTHAEVAVGEERNSGATRNVALKPSHVGLELSKS